MLTEINRHNDIYKACPVCLHEGWCATVVDEGNIYIVCKRDVAKVDVNGFRYIKDTAKEGNSLFIFGTHTQNKNWTPTPAMKSQKDDSIKRFKDKKLHEINSELLKHLHLEPHHRKYLNGEGITDGMIAQYNIKSFPVSDGVRYKQKIKTSLPKRWELGKKLSEKFGDLTGFPGAHLVEKGEKVYWTIAGQSGIVFPLYNVKKQIVALQVRLDHDDGGGKYRFISSAGNYYKNGCSPGSRIGVAFPLTIGDSFIDYITEGWKKALIASSKLGTIMLSIQGVNSWSELLDEVEDEGMNLIQYLKERHGVQMHIMALDNDKYKNHRVMHSQKLIIEEIKKQQCLCGCAEWDGYMGKGLDDMLNNGYKPMYVLPENKVGK